MITFNIQYHFAPRSFNPSDTTFRSHSNPIVFHFRVRREKKNRKTNWITTVAACSVHGFVETILYVIFTTTHLIMRPIEQIGCLAAKQRLWYEQKKKKKCLKIHAKSHVVKYSRKNKTKTVKLSMSISSWIYVFLFPSHL